ncbi:MAG: TonB-dependent receptor domain-containing protein [Janthinobacterium lividum]
MLQRYPILALLAFPLAAAAQTPADTLRPASPAPADTFRLQGQRQPIRPFLTLQDQLRTVAGVQVTPYDGSPGSGQVVRIRGASVALGQGQPLYVVDGLPALNDELTPDQGLPRNRALYGSSTVADRQGEVGANPLLLLPPEAIASIDVLAGPAAVARYGPLATNGVISIRTRRAAAGRLRVRYTGYGGVQQLRHRYDLLDATQFTAVYNEALQYRGPFFSPLSPPSGAGTDWQREVYRTAGLQQHQLSLEAGSARLNGLLSADYRQQQGLLRTANLERYGLRLALSYHPTARLALQGTLALNQVDQHAPYVASGNGATQLALTTPPVVSAGKMHGEYDGYDPFMYLPGNPLAVLEYSYRTPSTSRWLGQLGATYQPLPHLTVQATANIERTHLEAAYFAPTTQFASESPFRTEQAAQQTARVGQWAWLLALRYERTLGRHQLGAELSYQQQRLTTTAGYTKYPLDTDTDVQLTRPWASLRYTLDSALTVEGSLSYSRYQTGGEAQLYPSAQVSWHTRPAAGAAPTLALWLGAARTGLLGNGSSLDYNLRYRVGTYGLAAPALLYTDQAEVGSRVTVGQGRLAVQLVAYQRTTYHSLVPFEDALLSGYTTLYGGATAHNQGLELTLRAAWQAGRLQGATTLAASTNRNHLQGEGPAQANPRADDQPTGLFYGYQEDGVDPATGQLRFRQNGNNGRGFSLAVLGSGIPAQLASLSQQLRLGRLALDAQVDGLFGYQVLNQQRARLDIPTGYTNNATTVLGRWTPAQPNTSIPAAGSQTFAYPAGDENTTNRLVENGSHVRLSSLTLTYRLRHTATQDLSVWVGSQNLLVLTSYQGYDPNVSSGGSTPYYAGQDYGAVPVPRTWLLGVRASI